MNKEIITKLLKSTNTDDNLLGLELQYQAFKHGYTNWYKREKYNREFKKRILSYIGYSDIQFGNTYFKLGELSVHEWFKTRLEEDFKDNML